MDKKDWEQYKRILRALAALIVILGTTFVFYITWKLYYNKGVVFPFYAKGHWLVALVYMIFLIIFFYIYGGLKFGYLKCSSVILSQLLAVLCANFLTYLEIMLLSARIVNVLPMIAMTVVDAIIIMVLANAITRLFVKLFPPREMLLLYEEYEADSMLYKMEQRNDRFELKGTLCVKDVTMTELQKIIKKYDSVLVYDIHSELRNKIMKYCYEESIRMYVTPKISDIIVRGSESIHLFDSPLLLMRNNGLNFEQKFAKRFLDIFVSLLILIITSPLMAVVAICIKLHDGGPVMFRQKRCTIDGRVFKIHKFRSMIVDAEKDGKSVPATDCDPRITPIGNFIRKTRIDELPQMIDILFGDMSIVGPRPERIEHVESYMRDIPEFKYRMKVRGGLTGYAQIYGKYNTTAYDKLKLDLMYIQNYSLLLDIRLIFMTIKIMFLQESTEGFKNDFKLGKNKREEE